MCRHMYDWNIVNCDVNKGETITRVNGNVSFFADKCLQNF